jgi:hypothetical protein
MLQGCPAALLEAAEGSGEHGLEKAVGLGPRGYKEVKRSLTNKAENMFAEVHSDVAI